MSQLESVGSEMKKQTVALYVVGFLILSSLLVASLTFIHDIQHGVEESHIVMVSFRSNESDWFEFCLKVYYLGKIEVYNTSEISLYTIGSDEIRIRLDEEFKNPTNCELHCEFYNYNVTIHRVLSSHETEMLYNVEGNEIEWMAAIIATAQGN